MRVARGFTLLEILFAVAIVGILVAVAYPFYRDYQARSRAADIVVKYDGVRAGLGAELAQGSVENCSDLASRINPANLQDAYAKLGVGFERASASGYRAVLAVCADAAQQGALGVAVAREAHGVFKRTNRVEQGAVLTGTLVSFAVPLSGSDAVVCKVAPANPATLCGAQTGSPGTPTGTTPPITTAPLTPPPATTPPVTKPPVATGSADPQQPVIPPPQTQGQPAAGSQPGPSAGQSAPQSVPTQTPQECRNRCRQTHPHGNSSAYRACVAACG